MAVVRWLCGLWLRLALEEIALIALRHLIGALVCG
jgi:hypothetical protein